MEGWTNLSPRSGSCPCFLRIAVSFRKSPLCQVSLLIGKLVEDLDRGVAGLVEEDIRIAKSLHGSAVLWFPGQSMQCIHQVDVQNVVERRADTSLVVIVRPTAREHERRQGLPQR